MKIALLIGVFAVVIIIAVVRYFFRRNTSFSGVVVDKDVREQYHDGMNNNGVNQPRGGLTINMQGVGNSSGVTHSYVAMIKTDAGKTVHWEISAGMYETLNIGDRVNKPSGTSELTITAKAQAAAAPTVATTAQPPVVPPTEPPAGTILN